ncbi:MAG: hypothetical protein LBB52_01570, partial [Desulfovibrio sp.]|nr:hypothetical protein [Desulfovibrio sp.]
MSRYDFGDCVSGSSRRYNLPAEVCGGRLESFFLPCGLLLYIADIHAQRRVNVTQKNIKGSVGFGFCLSGNMAVKGFTGDKSIKINSGQLAVFSTPDFDSYTETVPQGKVIRLSVSISKDDGQSFIERYEDFERHYYGLVN